MTESLAFQRRAGVPVEQAMPLVFKAVRVRVSRLLDLTDLVVLKNLGIGLKQITEESWWLARLRGEESLTQALGRAAHSHQIQALRVPSAHSTLGANLVVFIDHLRPPDGLQVLRRIPRRR